MTGGLLRGIGYRLIARSLRRRFGRVLWSSPWPLPPADAPLVLYANHHLFYDSYLLGWFIERVLRRRAVVWMEDLDRFPFFAALGAMPFPRHSARRRAATVRRTARLMAQDPSTVLFYYPEARLHPAAEGLLDFGPDRFARLDRVLPAHKRWWPVALDVTDTHRAYPTVRMIAGDAHDTSTGHERLVLADLLARLEGVDPRDCTVLLGGARDPDQRWDFGFAARVLAR